MEKILKIVEEFSLITGTQINAEKSHLICINNTSKNKEERTIKFMGEEINAKEKGEHVRILGIWMTANGKKQYQKKLIEEKVKNFCQILKWKRATDKEVRYIINHVLFPAIEYLLNDIILSENVCNKLNSMCLKVIKHKAGFAQTAINSLFFLNEGYKVFNINDRQIQMHGKNINDRLNRTDILGITTNIRLQQFQNFLWTDKSFMETDKVIKIKEGSNLTASIINLCKRNKIKWHKTKDGEYNLKIPSGGKILIEMALESIGQKYETHRKSLREKKILYLEQILDLELEKVMEWSHIQANYKNRKGRIPNWYKLIKINEKRIIDHFREIITQIYDKYYNPFFQLQNNYNLTKQKWIAKKDTNTNQIKIGRIKKKKITEKKTIRSENKSEGKLLKHYDILTRNLEPTSVLIPCEGCEENIGDKTDECIIRLDNMNETEIEIPVAYSKVTTSETSIKKFKHRIRMPFKNIKKALEIIESTHKEPINDQNICPDMTNMETSQNMIRKWLTTENSVYKKLETIRKKLENRIEIKVYTDGSMKNILEEDHMGLGWVIPDQENVNHMTFRSNLEQFPSSTRAELMAILTALTVMPKRSRVNIYTDSKCAIYNINKVNKGKMNFIWNEAKNPVILQSIKEIIDELKLQIILHKIKAHEGNYFNEMADQLAQVSEKTIKEDYVIKINYNNIENRSFIPTWEEIPLELPIKQALKKINIIRHRQSWKLQKRFQKILDDEKTQKIDWITTFKTLHPSKITNDNTSKEDHIKRSFAMKLFNGELPVMLKRFKHQPHIYNNPKCILCGRYEETDIHVFECKRNNNEDSAYTPMTKHYKQLIDCLTTKILRQTDEIDKDKIQTELRSLSELWNWWGDTDEMSSPRITLHELIKGFIPYSLVFKVTSMLKSRERARETIIEGMVNFKEYLKNHWKEQCEKVALWETENNITNRLKRKKKGKSSLNKEGKMLEYNDRSDLVESNEGKYNKLEQIEKNTMYKFRVWINLGCKYNDNYSYRYNNYI